MIVFQAFDSIESLLKYLFNFLVSALGIDIFECYDIFVIYGVFWENI